MGDTLVCEIHLSYNYKLVLLFCITIAGEIFATLVGNYMRLAICKGVPPLFNNIRNLYIDKEKVRN